MLLALTGYQTALVVVAASFIVFALVMALVVPRSRPSFPGNRLGIFLVVCVLFFAAQLTAVLVLAEIGEAAEPAVAETTTTETTETTTTETTTTETTSPPTESQPTETTTETAGAAGDRCRGQRGLPG